MTNLADAYFLDCGFTYSGDPVTTLGGLDHLEGETVKIIADGKVVADQAVSGGSITLTTAASVIHVGLGYTAKMKTLPIEQGLQDGASEGRLKLVPSAIINVNESVGMLIGPDESNLDEIVFTEGETFATASSLFTGAYDVNIESSHNRLPRLVIHHVEGLPLTINAINYEYEMSQQ